jgi:hypothetical protein
VQAVRLLTAACTCRLSNLRVFDSLREGCKHLILVDSVVDIFFLMHHYYCFRYADAIDSREDAIFWLRVKSRVCIADLIRRSANLMAVEKGLVPDATPTMLATVAKESMNSSEVRGSGVAFDIFT